MSLRDETHNALLNAIKEGAQATSNPASLLKLSQAYALVTARVDPAAIEVSTDTK